MTTSTVSGDHDDQVLWDEQHVRAVALEATLWRSPLPLSLVTDRRPGAYVLIYGGPLAMYRPLRRPGGRRDRSPIVRGGGAPIYAGSAIDLRERASRHLGKLRACSNISPADVLMVPLPTSTVAGARYVESALIAAFDPVWNTTWMSGFGSKHRGALRAAGPPAPWTQMHPRRGEVSTLTPTQRRLLRQTIHEWLIRTVPSALRIRIDPVAPYGPTAGASSPLRLVPSP